MKIKFLITIALFLPILILVVNLIYKKTNKESTQTTCSDLKIVTLLTVFNQQIGVREGYAHILLLDGISLINCDSEAIIKKLVNYCDTVSFDRPVNIINIYNSDKRFESFGFDQDWENVHKDRILSIWLNDKSHLPERFFFYQNGKCVYEGNRWISDFKQ